MTFQQEHTKLIQMLFMLAGRQLSVVVFLSWSNLVDCCNVAFGDFHNMSSLCLYVVGRDASVSWQNG